MKIGIKTWLPMLLWLMLPVVSRAQILDTFYSSANGDVEALAVQPDGKIWIGGLFTTLNGQTNQALARVRADGSLDMAFNPGATTQDLTYSPQVIGVVIQPDGKVIAGGWFSSFAGVARKNIVRLNAAGTVDTTFNATFAAGLITGLALQADGKIIAASGANVYRINPDGARDTGFNVTANSPIDAVAIQPDGKILLSGAFASVNGSTHALIARVNSDGTVDSSFNYYQSYTSPYPDEVVTMTVQPDGKIVVGTEYWVYQSIGNYWQAYSRTLRITSTGALDLVMGSSGFDSVLTLQTDGKILAGSAPIYRLTSAGALDANFVTTAGANVMALQPDGRLLFGSPAGRLVNLGAATQNLSISGSTITWLRGGTSPEVWRTTFEYSTDHGANWTSLGAGVRSSGGWQEIGVSVPADANIRARGYIVAGDSSSWFVESIIGPVLLTGQPDSRTNNAGTVASFFATAGGTSLTYQWLKNGTNLVDGGTISGAQTSALVINSVLDVDAAQYSLVVSNYTGSVTSRVANLTVRAASVTVTSTADSGAGTLRAALTSAANGDTIQFALPLPAKITLTGGALSITKEVTILGPGASKLAVDGNAIGSVFSITTSSAVTLAGLTITNGHASFGGGIDNRDGNLSISNCVVTGNSADFGGAIENIEQTGNANLKIINSTISGNSAGNGGGAIYNVGTGGGNAMVQVINSTVSSNFASNFGGAIVNVCEGQGKTETHIVNSTFSDNSQVSSFGGVLANLRQSGGSANIALASSILDAGAPGINIYSDSGASITSLGYNLSSDDGGGLLTQATDQINTDPMLGPLQDNGGPTLTHALLPGSPAIDAGKNLSGSTTDQRGFARSYDDLTLLNAAGGDGTDIGAFEIQKAILLAIQSDGSGGFWVRFTAPTNVTYRLQRALSLTGTWSDLATNTVPASGLIEYHETIPPSGQAFYRTVQP